MISKSEILHVPAFGSVEYGIVAKGDILYCHVGDPGMRSSISLGEGLPAMKIKRRLIDTQPKVIREILKKKRGSTKY